MLVCLSVTLPIRLISPSFTAGSEEEICGVSAWCQTEVATYGQIFAEVMLQVESTGTYCRIPVPDGRNPNCEKC